MEDAGLSADSATFHGWTEVDFGGGATASGDPASGLVSERGKARSTVADNDDTDEARKHGCRHVRRRNWQAASVIGAFGATKQ